ncbi:MAG TPA: hypothetical protein DEF47_02800 [Herpetosiphon sp.]|uniref:MmyB-like transcription regulator ligand binding domain-containing protein n=1 Tax=Herpetosiphon aurantiacus (strain ATCC 23779 / DSM 785 / 114-95) TaxID=316274 RepID=A9AXL3_HERA2|nr:PAS domain-containing protein [Herpetosiphon sp.]ABX03427.1 hypothetical protein Haur_0779 [Herpetosiphon aurantiacus DSM 785]HBW48819.1 hypothetical protein [Herpetosiphon sp.]
MALGQQLVHPDCLAFVAVVEELLARRQQGLVPQNRWQLADDPWGPRAWNRTELEDMVYSSYKQMRKGRITRPPRREVVMDIADYLNCTIEERNRLLIAADGSPIMPYLTGAALTPILEITIEIVQQLSMPAFVINRDWQMHYFNEHLLNLFGVTPEMLAAIDPTQLNVLGLLCNPDLPLYPQLIQNRASWQFMVRKTIYGFKQANVLCQYEPWYQQLVAELLQLPEFASQWPTVSLDKPLVTPNMGLESPTIVLEALIPHTKPMPKRAWLRPLLMSAGYFQFDFPQIVAFLPANAESQAIYAEIGVPLGINHSN